jgi:hypothetical protein
MLGSLIGRAVAMAARGAATIALNAVVAELRKPETQQQLGRSANSAARVLGRAAGTLRNKLRD